MGDGTSPSGPYIDEVNRIARLLMKAWEDAEGQPVNASYVATFADMARAVVEDSLEKEGAITWDTTCLNCASVLESSYNDHVRAERAEARVAELERFIDGIKYQVYEDYPDLYEGIMRLTNE